MLNPKKPSFSQNGQRPANRIADLYTQQRDKVYSRVDAFNEWVIHSNALNGKLLLTGLVTALLLLIGLSLMLYRYVAFDRASTGPVMHQVKHVRHIRELILEEQEKKVVAPAETDSIERLLSPKPANRYE